MAPLMIDLFCGLGGGTEGALAEGFDCIGFDRERHRYPKRGLPESTGVKAGNIIWDPSHPEFAGETFHSINTRRLMAAPLIGGWDEYPAQLVLQDVLTIHGKQCRHAAYIWASPPCTEFSYMAMPWSRARQIAKALRGHGEFPEGYTGSRNITELTALFDACFRIQREACEAAGRYIPMVVENVKGAQPWVGKAKANFGSFYLWGDVAMVGNRVVSSVPAFGQWTRPMRAQKFNPDGTGHPQGPWFNIGSPGQTETGKNPVHELTATAGTKGKGSWFGDYQAQKDALDGIKCGGDWFNDSQPSISRMCSSKSSARKAASAQIAKIPFALSQYIARSYKPRIEATA